MPQLISSLDESSPYTTDRQSSLIYIVVIDAVRNAAHSFLN